MKQHKNVFANDDPINTADIKTNSQRHAVPLLNVKYLLCQCRRRLPPARFDLPFLTTSHKNASSTNNNDAAIRQKKPKRRFIPSQQRPTRLLPNQRVQSRHLERLRAVDVVYGSANLMGKGR